MYSFVICDSFFASIHYNDKDGGLDRQFLDTEQELCQIFCLMTYFYSWIAQVSCLLAWAGWSIQLKPAIRFVDLSKKYIPYNDAWDMQRQISDYHISQQELPTVLESFPYDCIGTVLCLQHPHVYTLGTATTENSGPFGQFDAEGKPLDYETIVVDRAGQATYHGPGQLIFYPIIDLVSSLFSIDSR